MAVCSNSNSCILLFAGVAISKDGIVYFADGANIRAIDESGAIRTVIGSQGPPQLWSPFPCQKAINISKVF
jgi:teneurin